MLKNILRSTDVLELFNFIEDWGAHIVNLKAEILIQNIAHSMAEDTSIS